MRICGTENLRHFHKRSGKYRHPREPVRRHFTLGYAAEAARDGSPEAFRRPNDLHPSMMGIRLRSGYKPSACAYHFPEKNSS